MSLIEELQVKETKIEDPYDPEKFDAINLDFYIDDTLFGEASISGINTNDAFLYDVGIFPWFRGKGYANQMLEYILDHYQVTNLTVRPDNIPAINLYKKHGFKIDRSFDDNGQEMFVMLKENLVENRNFVPKNVKKDTCVAVAYSMLTGMDYDQALKLFPNGQPKTLEAHLDLQPENTTLNKFLLEHKTGKFLVCISDTHHNVGHAVAVINGKAYNTQDYDLQANVHSYVDLTKESHITNNQTSFLDELDKHKNIKDNKYIKYAYQQLIDKFGNDLAKNGKLQSRVTLNGTEGFDLEINGTPFSFEFPFNCTEQEILKQINNITQKSTV